VTKIAPPPSIFDFALIPDEPPRNEVLIPRLRELPVAETEPGDRAAPLDVGYERRPVRLFTHMRRVPAETPPDVSSAVLDDLLRRLSAAMRQHGVKVLVGQLRLDVEPIYTEVEVPGRGLVRLFERLRLVHPRRERVLAEYAIRLSGRAA
jgi:hypothetical protein